MGSVGGAFDRRSRLLSVCGSIAATMPTIEAARKSGNAARDAVRAALKPTVAALQESSLRLLDRMIVAAGERK